MAVKKLSARQLLFCTEFIKDFNATQAYIRAGYKNNQHSHIYAYKILQNITIQKHLQEQKQKQAEKAEISIQWIIQELKQMYERCQSSLSSPGAIAGATKQLELLGKYLGMWIDKTEHSGEIKIEVIKFADVAKHESTGSNSSEE